MAFGEIYHFAAVFSNRIHKYSLSSQLFEAWPCWKGTMGDLMFLSLPLINTHINRNYMKIMYSQPMREQGYAGSDFWIFIKLSELLTLLKGRSLISIMLINLFLFLGNSRNSFKSVDIGYCSQNTTSLWPQHSCSAPHSLVTLDCQHPGLLQVQPPFLSFPLKESSYPHVIF